MKLNLVCEGMSAGEHAGVAQCIRYVCPDVALSEIDARSSRYISPEMIGALGAAVSAVAAVIALVLQARSLRKDGKPPTREEIHMSIVKVEVMLTQNLGPTLKDHICRELQKLPAPVTVRVGSEEKNYHLHVGYGDDVHTIEGQWSRSED